MRLIVEAAGQLSSAPTVRRRMETRAPSHRPDPTGGKIAAAERLIGAQLDQLAILVSRTVTVAAQALEVEMVSPPDSWVLLADGERRPSVVDRRWLPMLRGVAVLQDEACAKLPDGWERAWESRWVEGAGVPVLDVERELELRRLVGDGGPLDDLNRRATAIVTRLTPAPPAQQRELIWCQHHPDKLAGKYRSMKLCDACYARRQRASVR